MPDFFQTIVDTQATPEEATTLSQHVVHYLSERGIVQRKPNPDGGHPYGPEALSICGTSKEPTWREGFDHLQVMTGRMIHSQNMSALEPSRCACPSCETELESLDPDWTEVAHAWLSGRPDTTLACPHCGKSAPVTSWIYQVNYGFGSLAFRFWNWPPLAWVFVEELRRELGHRVILVTGKL